VRRSSSVSISKPSPWGSRPPPPRKSRPFSVQASNNKRPRTAEERCAPNAPCRGDECAPRPAATRERPSGGGGGGVVAAPLHHAPTCTRAQAAPSMERFCAAASLCRSSFPQRRSLGRNRQRRTPQPASPHSRSIGANPRANQEDTRWSLTPIAVVASTAARAGEQGTRKGGVGRGVRRAEIAAQPATRRPATRASRPL